MQQSTQLKEELTMSKSLAVLTQAYQEHAIQQINFSRYSVLASRDFVDQLVDVFSNVKASYRNMVLAQQHNKKLLAPLIQKNGKTAFILITASSKLYGDIIPKLCRLFIEEAKKNPQAELFMVGNQGKPLIQERLSGKNITFIEVPDTNITLNSLKELIKQVIAYEKVNIFYGKFNNLVSQEALFTSISGDIFDESSLSEQSQSSPQSSLEQDFLFEPSLPDVANFFENQIFSLILNQRVHEAQLGKFASRVKAMERAQSNMEKRITELKRAERRMKVIITNKKQQEQLAGRSLWQK